MINPDSLRVSILGLLAKRDYKPMDLGELANYFKLERADFPVFKKLADEMVKEGSVAYVKGGRLGATKDLGLVAGYIRFKQNGKAFIEIEGGKIINVNREDTGVAFDGDKVLARIEKDNNFNRRWRNQKGGKNERDVHWARVIRIIERTKVNVLGTLSQSHNVWHVIPDDPKFYYDIIVGNPSPENIAPKPKDGDKVLVRLNEWTQKHINPSGEIIECLGASHTPMAEYKAILIKYELETDFPDAVMAEVKKIPQEVGEEDIKGRLDLRDVFTLTIDPSDAKDFDDAISVKKVGKNIEVGVHIADVSYYVKPNSALDKEAQKRGNSTYLVGTVLPMLPFELSNGICSLVEGQDRLVKSVFLEFDPAGDCKRVHFANSVIRSNKRLSYKQAYAFLKENDLEAIKAVKTPDSYQTGLTGRPLSEFSDKFLMGLRLAIRNMWSLASTLRKKRMRKGSLNLDMPETRIFVDAEGYADRIEKTPYDESHQLIEEFMLAANEAVARELFFARIPFISRVHDDPEEDRLLDFREYAENFGIFPGDLTRRREVVKTLAEIEKHPQSYVLKTQFLRSLKRAVYRASPDGHFGLMKEYYAHFTSPIRRYADFTVHRALNYYMQSRKMETAPKEKEEFISQKALDSIAAHISKTEANSTDAERESRKVKLMEFFERKVGTAETFEAVVTSLTGHGFFVELTESMAFGFVHMHSLHDDIYKLNSDNTVFRGRKSGNTIKLGDKIRVAVESVDIYKRQIDFMKV